VIEIGIKRGNDRRKVIQLCGLAILLKEAFGSPDSGQGQEMARDGVVGVAVAEREWCGSDGSARSRLRTPGVVFDTVRTFIYWNGREDGIQAVTGKSP
jgi:hypothetical protein